MQLVPRQINKFVSETNIQPTLLWKEVNCNDVQKTERVKQKLGMFSSYPGTYPNSRKIKKALYHLDKIN